MFIAFFAAWGASRFVELTGVKRIVHVCSQEKVVQRLFRVNGQAQNRPEADEAKPLDGFCPSKVRSFRYTGRYESVFRPHI